ncbi:MAG: selenide, water dikinase SelD [Rubripirellula sp.]|nr:selenide, water dikinase SelD [Rubripirellula sp.]
MIETLKRKRVILLGIGHTNAHVLGQWIMKAPKDTELVCVSDQPAATYSGMLPAVLAGQRPVSAMTIDLVKLCAAASARLIIEQVTGIDAEKQTVQFAERPELHYDLLSIGIGSSTATITADPSTTPNLAISIKPMQSFLQRLTDRLHHLAHQDPQRELQVVVIGGGVASIEVCLCLPAYIESVIPNPYRISLVTSNQRPANELNGRAAGILEEELRRRGVQTVTESRVASISDQAINFNDKTLLKTDLAITSTGAAAPSLLKSLPFEKDEGGFLLVDDQLLAKGSNCVFAVGDCSSHYQKPLPKSGVYAVRQGPTLWNNLLRALREQPLAPFKPQTQFLKLINLGDGRALAHRGNLTATGQWVLNWKHRIDDRFISMYSDPHAPMSTATDTSPLDEQCRGCGCKLDSDSLDKVIQTQNPDGTSSFQDSVVIRDDGVTQLNASTDFFTAPFADAYLSGRIAALHSLSDLVASGSKPTSALSTLVLAHGPKARQQEQFLELSAGMNRELGSFGIQIGGGHTIVGPRTEIGLTVVGERPTGTGTDKDGLKSGDRLFLTKPLGSGLLMAAHMQAKCRASHFQELLRWVLQPIHPYLQLIQSVEFQGVTDVTGFGFAGHMLEMLHASQTTAEIQFNSIPMMSGVQEILEEGIQSTLAPDNHRKQRHMNVSGDVLKELTYPAIFDPQTCGGFIFGVPEDKVARLHDEAARLAIPTLYEIGQVCDLNRGQTRPPLTLK